MAKLHSELLEIVMCDVIKERLKRSDEGRRTWERKKRWIIDPFLWRHTWHFPALPNDNKNISLYRRDEKYRCFLKNRDDDYYLGVSITPECNQIKTVEQVNLTGEILSKNQNKITKYVILGVELLSLMQRVILSLYIYSRV